MLVDKQRLESGAVTPLPKVADARHPRGRHQRTRVRPRRGGARPPGGTAGARARDRAQEPPADPTAVHGALARRRRPRHRDRTGVRGHPRALRPRPGRPAVGAGDARNRGRRRPARRVGDGRGCPRGARGDRRDGARERLREVARPDDRRPARARPDGVPRSAVAADRDRGSRRASRRPPATTGWSASSTATRS